MRHTFLRAGSAVVGAAALLLIPSAAGAAVRHAPNHKVSHSTSTNWSGYAVAGGRYTTVWSSFWIGLDGDTSNTVEQTGTEADCSSGRAVYSAWYEMYPKYPKNYGDTV